MLNKELIRDAFILMISGAAQWKNKREFYFEDVNKKKITIEFMGGWADYVIERKEPLDLFDDLEQTETIYYDGEDIATMKVTEEYTNQMTTKANEQRERALKDGVGGFKRHG